MEIINETRQDGGGRGGTEVKCYYIMESKKKRNRGNCDREDKSKRL